MTGVMEQISIIVLVGVRVSLTRAKSRNGIKAKRAQGKLEESGTNFIRWYGFVFVILGILQKAYQIKTRWTTCQQGQGFQNVSRCCDFGERLFLTLVIWGTI